MIFEMLKDLWGFVPFADGPLRGLLVPVLTAISICWYLSQNFNIWQRFFPSVLPPSSPLATEVLVPDSESTVTKPKSQDGVKFSYPAVEACAQPIANIKPIPYRPFKWGPYHVTMGIRNMPWNEWIELDRGHAKYHRIKKHRVKTRGDKAVRVLRDGMNPGVPGGGEAAVELVHELAEYLSRRYPDDFYVVRHPHRYSEDPQKVVESQAATFSDWGWYEKPPIRQISITALGETYDLPLSVADGDRAPERALEIAGYLIQDDLALMIEGEDGRYYFQAGAICLPGFWRMEDKIGLPLDEIHITGHVPQYQEKLQKSMDRFFQKMGVDKPVIRNNYFFQTVGKEMGAVDGGDSIKDLDPEELGWANYTLGSEDEFEHGEVGNGGKSFTGVEEKRDERETTIEQVYLRSERQTLRRLVRSGAVVFTIRTYLTRVVDIAEEGGGSMGSRLASAIRSWPSDVGKYKGKDRGVWYSLVLAYLEGDKSGTVNSDK